MRRSPCLMKIRSSSASLYNEWLTAYPPGGPMEQALIDQAVTALIEKRRLERIRATLRTQKVRRPCSTWTATRRTMSRSACGTSRSIPFRPGRIDSHCGGLPLGHRLFRAPRRTPCDGGHVVWRVPDRSDPASGIFRIPRRALHFRAGVHDLDRLPGRPAQPQTKRHRPDPRSSRTCPRRCRTVMSALAAGPGGEPCAAPGAGRPRAAAVAGPRGNPPDPVRGAGAGRSPGHGAGAGHQGRDAAAPRPADPRAVVSAGLTALLKLREPAAASPGAEARERRRAVAPRPSDRAAGRRRPIRPRRTGIPGVYRR